MIDYPERVLIVLHQDGTLAGAHVERRQIIDDGAGTVLFERQLPAEPLDAATLAAILPDQGALLAQAATLTTALAAAEAQIVSLQDQLAAAGATAPQPGAPLECNAAQIRMALNQLGLRAAVEAAVAAGPADLQDLWQYSPRFVESDVRIAAMASAVGVDAAGLHDLFALAVTL
jgi:hypothetical protein